MGLFLHYCNFLVIFLPKNCINEINNPPKRISTMFWKITIMKFVVMKFGKILIYFVLKSVYFKKTVARICGTFNTNQNKKYHNFERNEIRTTVFLKWKDFKKNLKYHNSNCSTKHTDLVGAEPGIVHKNAGYLPWDHSAKFSAGQCHSTNVNNNFEYDGLQPTNIYDLLLKMMQWMNYYIYICTGA